LNASETELLPANWWQWLVHNVNRGCADESLMADLTKGGFSQEQAHGALMVARGMRDEPLEGTDLELPHVRVDGADINLGGHVVRVRVSMERPQLVVLDNVLTPAECELLIALGESSAKPSSIVDPASGEAVAHNARSGQHAFLTTAHPGLLAIETRLSQLLHWPVDRFEHLQAIGYDPGDEYRPHFDWFDPQHPGSASHLVRAGQRVGTLVMYLKSPFVGGATGFPSIGGFRVHPAEGSAVWFRDVDARGLPDVRTLHAGDPVKTGRKWIATAWLRQRRWRDTGV
jgi:prolyl 4-hydroxylase